jgi:hypothetical protein
MNPGTLFATVLLAAVAFAHLLRLFFGWQVTVADAVIPLWASGVAFAVSALAAVLLWKGSRPRN